ncbi:amidase [Rhodococcus sp. BP-252]|uniref:amidase n=1 Tax=unclassified Rhodococcus (in: high G+C Gram-positive bacteria) TaxID=192944 RepID=UPI0014300333|nr:MULTISPECIES: amidase [unclassified Rhodococcus (in: high G+C Gram-positive bacteria)]MBY6412018.1 amidase [Rhodococcus sp. BP-320]MBY6416598.1 amidase [Rhodococcus sp. BP-321]MBY6421213.1 amidase [Rhodococcus sp. BP-324]MBY6426622.1 amidase [Rhodococcus sp. BP-323]MBY6431621.1 amidase [Rhodococcus sp. BP-322]
MELYELSLSDVADKIKSKEVSPVEVAQSSLDRLAEVEPAITSFVTVTGEHALAQAAAAEAEIAAGNYKGALHGIPLGVKDLYDTAGILTTSSSAQRADNVPTADSASVAKLYDAGMIMVGKTHTHEFAYGATTPTSGNPWDPTRTPGGSSGGSGAAVGAGIVHVALGSDTGGSIRIPAGLCGTVGLKPTFGRASRAGVASLSWSLDHVGPLTRNVVDAGLVMAAMSGYDRRDPASVNLGIPDFVTGIDGGVAGKRIGIPTNFYTYHVEQETQDVARRAAEVLQGLGAELVEVEIPLAEYILPVEWGILTAEASAYHMDALRHSPEKFTEEVRTLVEAGEAVLATDYINSIRLRTRIQEAWRDMYKDIDVLLGPTVPGVAALREDPYFRWNDGVVEGATSAYSRMSAPANVTGLPALQVPAEFSAMGLPIGVQIIGKPFHEAEILQVGYALEQASDVVGRIAPVASAAPVPV